MAYDVRLDIEAKRHLEHRDVKKAKTRILRTIKEQLTHEPLRETTNRFEMEPNSLATWELRFHPYRIYYDVDEETSTVWVMAVGVKRGDTVYHAGREVNLHE